ncbi:hypothetical protein [Candidatus Frankia alpina]|uniref:hypothetical protein n=1 Tax=Candidatus Frankia alpina TaxID=2699483 RepID=UPI0013D678D5|nr:hypothetical protein [Candidatus Frankia alpina]
MPALATGAAHVSWGPVLGVEALVCFEPGMEEIDRRERVGLGAATDIDVLDLLLGLPLGVPVVTGGSEIEVLVPPEPHRSGRLAARTWWFTEEVHRTYLAGGDMGLRPVAALASGRPVGPPISSRPSVA